MPRSVWASVGAASLVAQVLLYSTWIADQGYRLATPRPSDGSLFPLITQTAVCGIYGVILFLGGIVLARHRLRMGVALTAAIVFALWLEPLANVAGLLIDYNANAIGSASSWAPYLPGWQGPARHHATHQPLTVAVAFAGGTVAGVLYGEALILHRRRHMSARRFIALLVLSSVAVVNLQDPLFFALGFMRYHKAIDGFTLWPGTWHQFPLQETLAFSTLMIGLVGFYCWHRLHGGDFLQPASTGPRALRRAIPFLAVIGVANSVMFCYIAILVLCGLPATITPAELPGFWSSP
ncbi:spirocyclase AveC family protein [Nonomuraea sp. NPDC001699]